MSDPIVLGGYRPGVIAEMIGLHMAYYGPSWNFGLAFEAKLAREIGDFLARYDPKRDLFLTATEAGRLIGTLTLDAAGADRDGVHLRWFVVAEAARGRGLGERLMAEAAAFLDERGHARAYLTTFRGLDAARALYERHGFRLVSEEASDPWSGTVGLQRFERDRSR